VKSGLFVSPPPDSDRFANGAPLLTALRRAIRQLTMAVVAPLLPAGGKSKNNLTISTQDTRLTPSWAASVTGERLPVPAI
jgi:hypothetical protein